ncbi:unnamed protein product, partial [Mesorhabditis belari]|uniref:Uncharacterized protein n=1 Tax=Mesorhabditis belari TaxID=2138241 RepID=A0AAF3F9U5_9BILA
MNKKRVGIFAAVITGIVILVVAIVVTVVLVTRKKDKKPESPSPSPSLDDIITANSTFPNGTYSILVSSLNSGPPEQAPLAVNLTMLNSLGMIVDNSSFIAQANRLSYLFVRLPDDSTNANRVQHQLMSPNGGNVGIRFGNSDTLNVIPLNLSLTLNSGVRFLGALSDRSLVYALEVTMADAMCSSDDSGSCSTVNWTPYSVSDGNLATKSTFDNVLPVACGSQCDFGDNSPCATTCYTCDGQQVAGENTPISRVYNMGSTEATNLQFVYETYEVPDKVTVYYEGKVIFDSGCLGTKGARTAPLSYSGKSSEIRVDVTPNCLGTEDTGWYFILQCPDATRKGFDASRPVDMKAFDCMKKQGFDFFIGEISWPDGSINGDGITAIGNAIQSGFRADAYIFPCAKGDCPGIDAKTQVTNCLSSLRSSVRGFTGMIWLDIEMCVKTQECTSN